MPRTKFQHVIFTAMMVPLMTYGITCYNVAMEAGKLSTQMFVDALPQLVVMAPIAFVLERALAVPSRRTVRAA